MNIEPELVEEVLDQVSAGWIDPSISGVGEVAGAARATRIETPYLQLVLQRLWEVERAGGSQVMRLETFRSLGGAERIVQDHLERALHTLSPAEQAAAASMFGHLVTPSGTKIAHGTADLANYASLGEGEVKPMLDSLARQRILRPLGGENGHAGDRYEIFHDVLAGAVLAWRTRHESDAAIAEERRRRKRFGWIAAVAIVGLALMAALAAFAWSQREEARKQAEAADTQSLQKARLSSRLVKSNQRLRRQRKKLRSSNESLAKARDDANQETQRAEKQKAIADEEARKANAASDKAKRLADDLKIQIARAENGEQVAESEKRNAEIARDNANALKVLAQNATSKALVARKRARARLYISRSLHLISTNPEASASAAVAASDLAESKSDVTDAENALRAALVAMRVEHVLSGGGSAGGRYSRLSTNVGSGAEVGRFSGNGRRAAVGVGGNTSSVRVFRVRDGKLLRTFTAGAPVLDVALNRDGRLLAAAGADGRVWVWDVDTRNVRQFDHGAPVAGVAWSPTADVLVSVGAKVALLWDVATGIGRPLQPQSHDLNAAVFSRDGQRVATYGEGHFVRIFNVETGIRVSTLPHPVNALPVTSAAFSPDGSLMVTGRGNNARLWDIASAEVLTTFPGHTGTVTDVAFSEDGKLVATGSADTVARTFSVATGTLQNSFWGHSALGINDVDFSPEKDSTAIVTAGDDHTARFFANGQNSVLLLGHKRAVLHASFSPDGRKVLTSSRDGRARLWDPYGEPVPDKVANYGEPGGVTSVSVDRTGTLVAVGGRNGAVHVLSLGGKLVSTPVSSGSPIVSVAWARRQRLLAASRDGHVRIWDDAGASPVRDLDHGSTITAAAISPDGRLVATADNQNGEARLWRIEGGAARSLRHDGRGPVSAVAFDPTGRVLATARGSVAYTWAIGGQSLERFEPEGEAGSVTSLAFRNKGDILATAIGTHVQTWNAKTAQLRKTFVRHGSAVRDVAFSPDGRWLASVASRKGAIWQVGDSDLDGNFLLFTALPRQEQSELGMTSVAFAKDHTVVMGNGDGKVLVYRCSFCGRLPQLRRIANDKLAHLAAEARR
jgi:WD40 repeat protein